MLRRKVLFCQCAEEVLLHGILDAGYEFAEAPIHIIHFVCACPVAAFLVQLVPVAHVDERCREVQSVVRHRKETIVKTKREIRELRKTLIFSVLPPPISRKPLTFRDLGVYVWCLIIEFKFMDAKLVKIFGITKCFGNILSLSFRQMIEKCHFVILSFVIYTFIVVKLLTII